MGADLHWLQEDMNKSNGQLIESFLDDVEEILDDGKPFKVIRLKKVCEEYDKKIKRI